MQDRVLKSFESMLKNGDYAEAEALLKKFMELNPEDREAKMLYGTCRLLQGDTATAVQIHDEVAPYFSADPNIPKAKRNFWQKYHNRIEYGTVAALGIGGAAVSAIRLNRTIRQIFDTAATSRTKYAAPEYYVNQPESNPERLQRSEHSPAKRLE